MANVTVDILGDAESLKRATNDASRYLKGVDTDLDRTAANSNTKGGIIKSAFKGLLSGIAIGGGIAIFNKGLDLLKGGIGGIGTAFKLAAEKEVRFTQFEGLLGDAELAKARVNELNEIANETPFSNANILDAGKLLQALTGDALSAGNGFKLVVDTASNINPEEFQSIARAIGRAYSGLQNGTPIGEAMLRLQELGAVSGKTSTEMAKLQKEGASGAAVWAVLNKELAKNAGGAQRLSGTFSGMISTLKGKWADLLADLGMPLTDVIKPLMNLLIEGLDSARPILLGIAEKAKAVVSTVVQFTRTLINVFKSGQIGSLFQSSMIVAGKTIVNFLATGLFRAFVFSVEILRGRLNQLFSAAYWASVGQIIMGSFLIAVSAFARLGAVLMEAAQPFVTFVVAGVTFIGDKLQGVFLAATSTLLKGMLWAADKYLSAITPVASLLSEGMAEAVNDARNIVSVAQFGNNKLQEKAVDLLAKPFSENKSAAESTVQNAIDGLTRQTDYIAEEGAAFITKGVKTQMEQNKAIIGDAMKKASDADAVTIFDTTDDVGAVKKIWDQNTKGAEEAKKVTDKASDRMVSMGDSVKDGAKALKDAVGVDSLQEQGGGGFIAGLFGGRLAAIAGGGSKLGGTNADGTESGRTDIMAQIRDILLRIEQKSGKGLANGGLIVEEA